MSNKQLKIDYDAAQKVKTAFDNAEEDLEANADTMPSSGKYGEGDTYITFALTNFADASGTFGQAAEHGSTAIRDGIDSISGVDNSTAENIRQLAKDTPNG